MKDLEEILHLIDAAKVTAKRKYGKADVVFSDTDVVLSDGERILLMKGFIQALELVRTWILGIEQRKNT